MSAASELRDLQSKIRNQIAQRQEELDAIDTTIKVIEITIFLCICRISPMLEDSVMRHLNRSRHAIWRLRSCIDPSPAAHLSKGFVSSLIHHDAAIRSHHDFLDYADRCTPCSGKGGHGHFVSRLE